MSNHCLDDEAEKIISFKGIRLPTGNSSTNWTACTDFPNIVAKRHIFGGVHPQGYDRQIWTRPRFLYNAPTSYPQSFIILYLLVWKLSCWQTNIQTPLKASNTLRYATALGKNRLNVCSIVKSAGMAFNVFNTLITQLQQKCCFVLTQQ